MCWWFYTKSKFNLVSVQKILKCQMIIFKNVYGCRHQGIYVHDKRSRWRKIAIVWRLVLNIKKILQVNKLLFSFYTTFRLDSFWLSSGVISIIRRKEAYSHFFKFILKHKVEKTQTVITFYIFGALLLFSSLFVFFCLFVFSHRSLFWAAMYISFWISYLSLNLKIKFV